MDDARHTDINTGWVIRTVGAELEDVGVDIVEGDDEMEVSLVQKLVEFGFVETVAFAHQPFDAVAVHGVVEFALGGGDEHLCRLGDDAFGHQHPMCAERECHDAVPLLKDLVDQFLAAQSLIFPKGEHYSESFLRVVALVAVLADVFVPVDLVAALAVGLVVAFTVVFAVALGVVTVAASASLAA